MALAAVQPLRPYPLLRSADEVADFEQDLLSEFVMARASSGLADGTISGDVDIVVEVRDWFGRRVWELEPAIWIGSSARASGIW